MEEDKKSTLHVHLFLTLDTISGTNHIQCFCLSSPPSFCVRLIFSWILISILFPRVPQLHPYMYMQWIFLQKVFFPTSCTWKGLRYWSHNKEQGTIYQETLYRINWNEISHSFIHFHSQHGTCSRLSDHTPFLHPQQQIGLEHQPKKEKYYN